MLVQLRHRLKGFRIGQPLFHSGDEDEKRRKQYRRGESQIAREPWTRTSCSSTSRTLPKPIECARRDPFLLMNTEFYTFGEILWDCLPSGGILLAKYLQVTAISTFVTASHCKLLAVCDRSGHLYTHGFPQECPA